MIVDPNLALQAFIKLCEVILAVHGDIPEAERVKTHERWGRIFDGLWSFVEKNRTDETPS